MHKLIDAQHTVYRTRLLALVLMVFDNGPFFVLVGNSLKGTKIYTVIL